MTPDTSFLLIGALATKANTTKDTVRHYDQLGLLKSRKRQAGSRLYTEFHPECVERIELIKSAQAIGFTLAEIRENLNDYYDGQLDIDLQLTIIQQKLTQVRKQQANISVIVALLTERIEVLEQMKKEHGSKLDIEICKKKYQPDAHNRSD
ncbi:MerR family transcriptional regulator [Psychrobacter sp. B38]|uniref:MerR family transcriptional regulator n=1 Tax=Psychrobacter sp. B38 TaxID=3143538 RepID=UPI0032101F91